MATPLTPPTRRSVRGPWSLSVLVLGSALALIVLTWLARLWTDVAWFRAVGHEGQYARRMATQALLCVGVGSLAAAVTGWAMAGGWRGRPEELGTSAEEQALARYRHMVEPLRRLLVVGIPLLVGLVAGAAAASQWGTVLLFLHRQPFGRVDPQFGLDLGWYVFVLPLLQAAVDLLTFVLATALALGAVSHLVNGGVRMTPSWRVTRQARLQLGLLGAALLLTRAAGWWLDRYDLTTSEHRRFTGTGYTEVNVLLPALGIVAVAAVIVALLLLAGAVGRLGWRLPAIGLALLLVTSLVGTALLPAVVQRVRVNPSEQSLESPYIQRHIEATREAYGVASTELVPYAPVTDPTEARVDPGAIPGVRLIDPAVVSGTFKQLQARPPYYQFADSLDVDRYEVDGRQVDSVVAVRELDLDGVPAGQRSWLNDHTVYTHGYGVVAAHSDRRTQDGKPVFWERDIPTTGGMGEYEPRIYFGELSPEYSVVGGPQGAAPRELDHPDDSGSGQRNTTYRGLGGVSLRNPLTRLAYALQYRETNLLLSDAVTGESRLLDHRQPRDRVSRVAPWLTVDGNPYPAVVDGRVQWILDGYTTTSHYPNSALRSLGDTTLDSVGRTATNVSELDDRRVNYIRNSVKATVDAYDGTVRLYTWDEEDPLLRAWSAAFPGCVHPMSEISGPLMSHLRYPQDLFKVQREVISTHHVTDAQAFYTGQDFWRVPDDAAADVTARVASASTTAPASTAASNRGRPATGTPMPAYYVRLQMPGQGSPTFSLTSPFVPVGGREQLAGVLAVDADAGSRAGTRRAGYGQLRLLELPRETTVFGPGQVTSEIESSSVTSDAFSQTLSQFIALNRTQGARVQFGNLLTLPVGGGILYVEPLYVSAQSGASYPQQRVVVAAFGDRLAWSDSPDAALAHLFGQGGEPADASSGTGAGAGGDATPRPSSTPGASATPVPGSSADPQALADALADAQKAMDDADAALRAGDFEAYGKAQDRLSAALARAIEAQPAGGSVTLPSATPTP